MKVIDDGGELEAAAELLGRLLLHELDEGQRALLVTPEFAQALAEVGIDTHELTSAGNLDELAAQFFELFVQPQSGGPLVQSLWVHGSYEGDCAVAVRKLSEAAGCEFDPAAARGAPHDHIGCIVLLWATLRESAPEAATRLQREHMAWAIAPLSRIGEGSGFYAGVARAAVALLQEISSSD